MESTRTNGQQRGGGNHDRPSARQVYEGTRRVGEELSSLGAAARRTIADCEALARDRIERRPYAALTVAAGIGYVLGGGLPSGVVRLAIGLATRVAFERALATRLSHE